MTVTALLDGNVIKQLVDQPGLAGPLMAAVDRGSVRLIGTHIEDDEGGATVNPEVRERLLGALSEVDPVQVPTAGVVFDISRFDEATLVSDMEAALFERLLEDLGKDKAKDVLLIFDCSSPRRGPRERRSKGTHQPC